MSDSQQFRQAQIAYDNQEPPEEGECHHVWRTLPGKAKDGTQFAKCRKCGETVEI